MSAPASTPVATPEAVPAVAPEVPAAGTTAPSAAAPVAEPVAAPEVKQAEAAPISPSEYTDFVLPEGYAPSAESLKSHAQWAGENKLSQEQAQAYLDLDAKRVQERRTQFESAVTKQEQEWAEAVSKDPVLGKIPNETKTRVDNAMSFFLRDDPDSIKFLKESGWDKHPGFVRLMYRVNDAVKHMSPDTFGPKAQSGVREKTLFERMAPEAPNP